MADQSDQRLDIQALARSRTPRRRHRYKDAEPSWTPGEGFADTPLGFRPAVAVSLLDTDEQPAKAEEHTPISEKIVEDQSVEDGSSDSVDDDFDAGRALSVLITAMVICVGLVMLFRLTAPSQVVTSGGYSGDSLGPDGQDSASYVAAADATLEGDDTAQHWGLIAFGSMLSAESAAERIGDQDLRIGSIIVGTSVVRGVPSPFEGRSLAQVFETELDRATRNNGGIAAPGISGVVAYGTRQQFEAIRPRVLAIQVLPEDAKWGKISVTSLAPITSAEVISR